MSFGTEEFEKSVAYFVGVHSWIQFTEMARKREANLQRFEARKGCSIFAAENLRMETQTGQLLQLRPYLFKIAYSMTGDAQEAEDLVQDVFETWLKANREDVANPKAYLARMIVNRSINRLEELKRIRESYTGTWLPEPYLTLENDPGLPTIDYGLLFLLERLNPVERAVFILRESFSEEYESIAAFTQLSEENCRQLLHRARQKLQQSKTKPVDPAQQKQLTEAFLFALHQQDRSALEKILRKDIELFADGGGKRAAALRPLFGLEKVLKFLLGVTKLELSEDDPYEYRSCFMNGLPAALIIRKADGTIDAVQYVDLDDAGIARLLFMRNPDKLKLRG